MKEREKERHAGTHKMTRNRKDTNGLRLHIVLAKREAEQIQESDGLQ